MSRKVNWDFDAGHYGLRFRTACCFVACALIFGWACFGLVAGLDINKGSPLMAAPVIACVIASAACLVFGLGMGGIASRLDDVAGKGMTDKYRGSRWQLPDGRIGFVSRVESDGCTMSMAFVDGTLARARFEDLRLVEGAADLATDGHLGNLPLDRQIAALSGQKRRLYGYSAGVAMTAAVAVVVSILINVVIDPSADTYKNIGMVVVFSLLVVCILAITAIESGDEIDKRSVAFRKLALRSNACAAAGPLSFTVFSVPSLPTNISLKEGTRASFTLNKPLAS